MVVSLSLEHLFVVSCVSVCWEGLPSAVQPLSILYTVCNFFPSYSEIFFDNGNKSSGFSMIMRTANTSRLLQLRTVA